MEIIRLLNRCYCLRVSLAAICLPALFVENLLLKCEAAIACEHQEDGKRTHLHFALFNSSIGHDPLRKYVNSLLKDVTNLEGNSLLSLKKWDLSDKYLVYIIKGKNEFIINSCNFPIEDWERLKSLWVSQSPQENDYSAFKASPFYPVPLIMPTGVCSVPFEKIVKSAKDYSLKVYGGFVNAKVRYLAKDLISNYCLFNDIKMCPVYI